MLETLHWISSLPFHLLLHLRVCWHLFPRDKFVPVTSICFLGSTTCKNRKSLHWEAKCIAGEEHPLSCLSFQTARNIKTLTWLIPQSCQDAKLQWHAHSWPIICILSSPPELYFLGYNQQQDGKDKSLLISKLQSLMTCRLMWFMVRWLISCKD